LVYAGQSLSKATHLRGSKTSLLRRPVLDTEYHSTSSNNTSIYFDLLPEGPDNDAVSEMRDELVKNAGDWPMLRRRLTKVFGGDTALFLEYLIFWSGKSHAPDGWVWKSRDEIEDLEKGTGQGHREQEKARKILRGDKPRDGRTFQVVEECRPSRRRATFYRVDLAAVANIIGVELLSAIEDDFVWFDREESESPHGATRNGDATDKPLESPHGATESPHGTSESPHWAASVDTSVGTYSGSTLQVADEPAFAEPSAYEYLENEEKNKVWALILSGDTDVSRFAANCINQRSDANGEAFTTERLIRKIKELTGSPQPIEAYEPFVKGCLEELARETA
jgi:hypothetical protein